MRAINLKRIFLYGFFLSVFIFWPYSKVAYELPKVWFVLRWIELMGVLLFVNFGIFRLNNAKKIDYLLIIITLAFLLVAVVSSLAGYNLNKSIVGNYYRSDGLISLFHYVLLFFIITLFHGRERILNFVTTLSVSSILLSLISLTQWYCNLIDVCNIPTWDGGFGHVFGNPNFLAGYLIVTLPATAYLFDGLKFKKIYIALAMFVHLSAILLTNAWVGYFGILIFAVLWMFMKFPKRRWVILLMGAVISCFMFIKYQGYERSLSTPISINPESRSRIFMKSILAIQKKPILGFGWANFDKAFESVDYPLKMEHDVYVDKAHSSVLEVLTTTGLIGLIIYLIFVFRVFMNLLRLGNKYLIMIFVLLVLHMQTNIISVSEEIVFWILAGFSAKKL